MTVKQLIEKLQEFNPDLPVVTKVGSTIVDYVEVENSDVMLTEGKEFDLVERQPRTYDADGSGDQVVTLNGQPAWKL